MPDLNLDLNFRDHPKTRRFIAILGKDSEWLVVKLWLYVGRLHPEGRLKDYSGEEIERLVEWSGTPGAFIEAMERVGWIEKDEKDTKNTFKLLGWKDHQGHLVSFKRRGKIAAKSRWDKYKQTKKLDASSMHDALHKRRLSNTPPDGANGANLTEIRECEGGESLPVEFPKGFPPDEKSAIDWARVGGSRATDEQIKLYWNEAAARNGTDVTGQPINRWSQHCNGRAIRSESKQAETAMQKQSRPASSMDIRNVIEAKKSMANDIRNQYASECAAGTSWSDQAKRREYFQIHKEIKELTKKMATML